MAQYAAGATTSAPDKPPLLPPAVYQEGSKPAPWLKIGLFAREDEVERAWSLVDAVETGWAAQAPPDFPNYAAGSWGPEAADALAERDGRRWRRP